MAFPNLYYKRTAATARACYICYKPTATVLATIDTVDFFYTCPIHLSDRGFATRVEPDPKKSSISPEEIAKVKQEWEEKQRQNKVQGKKEGQVDGDGKNSADGAPKEGEGKDLPVDAGPKAEGSQDMKPVTSPPPGVSTPKSTHERYVLHRNVFALRTADHRRRRQAAQAKDLVPRLPGAPSSLP